MIVNKNMRVLLLVGCVALSYSSQVLSDPKEQVVQGARQIFNGITDALYIGKTECVSHFNYALHTYPKAIKIGGVAAIVTSCYVSYKFGRRSGKKQKEK